MAKRLFWEDIEEGSEIPPLMKEPTTEQLVRWAGASGDYYQIHYDKDFALGNALPSVVVHGALKSGWLGQLLGDWVGDTGTIKKYGCTYRGMDVPGEKLTCKGKVVKKYVEGDELLVELEIWIENGQGQKTTLGTGVVGLPSKS
ncbi:MaoC/PaaZ C-terminal domain-containing protein [Chloroflexota bacterium]